MKCKQSPREDGAGVPCSTQLKVNRAEVGDKSAPAMLHFTQAAVAIAICLYIQKHILAICELSEVLTSAD
jgi:hypothetical protein